MIPRILISAQAFERLNLYIDISPSISLIRQRASDADIELDPEAVADHLLRILQEAGDLSAVRLWWHRHSPTTFLPIQNPCGGRLWQNCGRKCASSGGRFPLCPN